MKERPVKLERGLLGNMKKSIVSTDMYYQGRDKSKQDTSEILTICLIATLLLFIIAPVVQCFSR
jgi:hypothetical protein